MKLKNSRLVTFSSSLSLRQSVIELEYTYVSLIHVRRNTSCQNDRHVIFKNRFGEISDPINHMEERLSVRVIRGSFFLFLTCFACLSP